MFFAKPELRCYCRFRKNLQDDFDINAHLLHLILPKDFLRHQPPSLKRGMDDRAETDLPCSFQKPSFVCCVTQLVYQLQGWDLPSSECELDSNGTDFPWPLPTNPPISISFHFLAQKSASRDHCDCNGSIFPQYEVLVGLGAARHGHRGFDLSG